MTLAPLDAGTIRERLSGVAPTPHVHVVDTVDSTNRLAREHALAGSPDGTLVVAETQDGGRGREGRAWFSPPGAGLWMTVLRRVPVPARRGGLVPLAVGLAVCEALERTHAVTVGLKWPNDVVAGGRKLGGILVESSTAGEVLAWIVIGIGVNLAIEASSFPEELVGPAVSLTGMGVASPDRTGLLVATYEAVVARTTRLVDGGREEVADAFGARDVLVGRRVRVHAPADTMIEGVARGVDADGALRIERAVDTVRVRAGTVRLVDE